MPTNDERREVAARLRALDASKWSCYGHEFDERMIAELMTACGCNFGQSYQEMELKDRLAYLIEPEPEPTCKMRESFTEPMTLEHMQEYECSECGGLTNAQVIDKRDEPRYCAMCGAKAVL